MVFDCMQEESQGGIMNENQQRFVDYVCFSLPGEPSSSDLANCIVVTRCLINDLQAVLLCVPDGYRCVDLSLYKVTHVSLLITRSLLSQSSRNMLKKQYP